jgi:hypothetical protein
MKRFTQAGLLLAVICTISTHNTCHGQANLQLATALGIVPESLAIAGVELTAIPILFSQLESETTLLDQLTAQSNAANDTIQTLSALTTNLGEADVVMVESQCHQALEQLSDLKLQIDQLQLALFNEIVGSLTSEQATRLQAWRSSVGYEVPAEFRAVSRSHDEWLAIERAVRAESRCARTGEPVPEQHSQLLAVVRADPCVVSAHNSLYLHLDMIVSAFSVE